MISMIYRGSTQC